MRRKLPGTGQDGNQEEQPQHHCPQNRENLMLSPDYYLPAPITINLPSLARWGCAGDVRCGGAIVYLIMSEQRNITLKYLVVGDSGVGKTSLLVRYCEDSFQSEYLSTIGVDFKIKRIRLGDCHATLNIWDTAGQERFRNITKSFYKGAHGIILVYSITDLISFGHVESWVDQIREVGNAETNMILVAAKADMETERKITRKQGEALAERYRIKFVETSAKHDSNIATVFELLTADIIKDVNLQEKTQQKPKNILTDQKEKEKKKQCCA